MQQYFTLWELRDHEPNRSVNPELLAAALREFHAALVDYPRELPAFTRQVEEVGNVLSHPSRTPKLAQGDRKFLRTVQSRLFDSLLATRLSY